jgi:peptidoglycan/xylan/chitin deacetylase (PgdA/CDA1 family)
VTALPPAVVSGELVRLQTSQHVVALTFDGGGNATGALGILAVLKRQQVRATFFLTGQFVRTYPNLARAIGKTYLVGNHTVDHLPLPALSSARVFQEIGGAATMIKRPTGRDPHPHFRFPYGARDARALMICHRLGYVSVRWTVDTLGWMGEPTQTPAGATRRVLENVEPGEIILMHLGSAASGSIVDTQALPGVIRAVRARGYRFVTLSGVRGPR